MIGLEILFQLTLAKATPLLLAALGGLYSERSGVVNIGLEGTMLVGAFFGAAGSIHLGSAWLGLAIGALSGAMFGGIHALATVWLRSDPIVSGTAINLLAIGLTGFLLFTMFGAHGSSPSAPKLPVIELPVLRASPLAYLALLLVPITWFILFRTKWGLRLRAVGESPETVRSTGLSVIRLRLCAVILSGALAGLGGAHLSLGDLSQFVERMTAGRGFIALAALIFGRWHPIGVLGACLFFGAAEAIADTLQGWTAAIPSQVFLALPFILTMVVLAGFAGRSRPPAALGMVDK